MEENRRLIILNDTFGKEGSDEEIAGLTILVDGTIKIAFDKIQAMRQYDSYNEVLRDVIFEGLEKIFTEKPMILGKVLMVKNILLTGSWYGEISSLSVEELREKLVQVQDEKDCILLIAELLKKGEFSVKNLLIDLMNTTKDDAVLNLCIRLFCSVCTHEDLENPQNLNFLANVSELGALTFASSAINSLSYEVIPYLLALWEDWEDTDVAVAIRDSLDSYLDYYDVLGEEADLDEVGQYYLDKVQSVDKRLYYYEKGPIFLGDLTKIIFQRLYMAANQKERFALFIQPSLLSVLSGYHFPLEYGQEVSEQDLRKAQEFVDFLAQKEWKKSTKYFYGYNL